MVASHISSAGSGMAGKADVEERRKGLAATVL